jgi:hypothetical protein
MGLLDYKVYIKFDESVNYKDLNFLGSNSFNTIDFLNQKLGDNNFIEKAKKMLSDKMSSVSGQNPIFSQINDKMAELKEFYLFPVPPSELKFKSIGGWESIDTVNGILKLKNKNKLQSLAFSSIIPEQKYNFATHHLLDPFTTFLLFKSLEMSDKAIRLILVGKLGKGTLTSILNPVDLNFLATVNKFEANFDVTGTLNFEIEFEEYPEFSDITEVDNPEEKLFYKVSG